MKKEQKSKNKFVKNIKQLIELINKGHHDYAVLLGGGIAFSRKTISYREESKKFFVINHIDDTEQNLSHEQIMDNSYTHIGTAMPLKSLICVIE